MPKLGSKRTTPTKTQKEAQALQAWHDSPEGLAAYSAALKLAQARADELKMDHALEFNGLFRYWTSRILPQKQHRYGSDHTCQVVMPTVGARPGHGPTATRPPSTVGPEYHGGPFDREKNLAAHREWVAKHGPLYPDRPFDRRD
jgi:hypothetical protein